MPSARGPWLAFFLAAICAPTTAHRATHIAPVTNHWRMGYKVELRGTRAMEVNDKAPEFTLPDENGENVSLKDFRGKTVVLFFYPKADTPG
jgi:cytochrome oxidase Cu insertion factor (SCO1/SenC/PrrC family)